MIYTLFDFLSFFTIQDGRTPAEVAQSTGYQGIAKLIIDEGMYFRICDNNYVYHNNFIFLLLF